MYQNFPIFFHEMCLALAIKRKAKGTLLVGTALFGLPSFLMGSTVNGKNLLS